MPLTLFAACCKSGPNHKKLLFTITPHLHKADADNLCFLQLNLSLNLNVFFITILSITAKSIHRKKVYHIRKAIVGKAFCPIWSQSDYNNNSSYVTKQSYHSRKHNDVHAQLDMR